MDDALAKAIDEYRQIREKAYRRGAQSYGLWIVGIALATVIAYVQKSELQGFWLFILSVAVTVYLVYILNSVGRIVSVDDRIKRALDAEPVNSSLAPIVDSEAKVRIDRCDDPEMMKHNRDCTFALKPLDRRAFIGECEIWFQPGNALPVVARMGDRIAFFE